jgi:hypothetical protein
MRINFRKVTAPISFDGKTQDFDIAKAVGNAMMYNGSVLLDIGFEDLARKIYHSGGDVEIPDEYIKPLVRIIQESAFIATVKRELLKMLGEIH